MKKGLKRLWRRHASLLLLAAVAALGLAGLLLYKLGSLTGGLGPTEAQAATQAVGFRGIWHDPWYLPLKLVRSIVFWVAPDHGQILTRLPNVVFGGLAMVGFAWLIHQWHGRRTAILTTLLFASSAWVLHVSRLASFDGLYLWAVLMLLVVQASLYHHAERALVWYGSLIIWGLLLYIPGLVWLVLLQLYLQRKLIIKALKRFNRWWQQVLTLLVAAVWLPLLIIHLIRPGQLVTWLGLPTDWPTLLTVLKQLAAVPVHLFIRGPEDPERWLGQAPLLDAFTLVMATIGIYFYTRRLNAWRSRSIALMAVLGGILVGIGGPVSLSLLVPLVYVVVATGIAYLLHDWLKVFPFNPLARGLGIGLVSLAVGLSCLYNLRAYFIAWPHNTVTMTTFRHYR